MERTRAKFPATGGPEQGGQRRRMESILFEKDGFLGFWSEIGGVWRERGDRDTFMEQSRGKMVL